MKTSRTSGTWKLGRRATLGISDQILSSITNFALNIIVVRSVSTDAFGSFALAFSLYILLRSAVQALVSQPLLVRHTEHAVGDAEQTRLRKPTYELALGASLQIGVVVGLILVLVCVFVSGDLRSALLALAVVLPGVLLQEIMRVIYFAQGRPQGALVIDLAWAIAQLGLIGGLLGAGHSSVALLLLAWGVSGGLSALLAMAYEHLRPRLSGAAGWLYGMRDLSMPFFGETLLLQLSSHGVAFLLAGIAGVTAVGTLRSAQILFSPLNVLFQAVPMLGIPEGVRLFRRRPERFVPVIFGGTVVLVVGVGIWCLAIVLLPDAAGEALLGDSWASASQILPVTSLAFLGGAAGCGALVGLRVLEAARATFVAGAAGAVVGIVLGTIGAAYSGAGGAAVGLAASAILTSIIQWVRFGGRIRQSRQAGGAW